MSGSGSETDGPPLLAGKLAPPALRSGLVNRPELLPLVRASFDHRLTLISAPAGWGKTTLLSQWQAADGGEHAFGWVSLDAADRDPGRFWTYVIEALARASEELAGPLAQLRQSGPRPADIALTDLVAALETRAVPVALVIDDGHLAVVGRVAEGVAWFVEHMPDTLSVVIATREDLPLPLGRLRARGQLVEVRAPELRFSAAHADSLLIDACGECLGEEEVERLLARTEGWPAGLYLAGLWLRDRADPGSFIDQFAGDDRHIVDYLGPEVLDAQRPEIRAFMAQTSILERLCAPLCDAVTGRSDSALLLEHLERSNLFLVPLDTRREWYRYHHLFGELLQRELIRTDGRPPAELHRRAARWHRDQGLFAAAVRHSLAADDIATARELIAEQWLPFSNRGRVATVAGWLAALPDEVVAGDVRLALAAAWTALAETRLGEVEGWLAVAEACEASPPLPGASSVESSVAMARAAHRAHEGDIGAAATASRRAADLEPDPEAPGRARALAALGSSLYWTGDPAGALEALQEAAQIGGPTGQHMAVLLALGHIAAIHADAEELAHARQRADEALELAKRARLDELADGAVAHLARGVALMGEREEAAAVEALQRAVDLASRGAGPTPLAAARIELARARHACGDIEHVPALLRDARAAVRGCIDPGIVAERLVEAEAELGLAPRAAWPAAQWTVREELTERETAVLRMLPTALSQGEIADQWHVSRNTVKTHVRSLYRKLGVGSRHEAVRRARELGLI